MTVTRADFQTSTKLKLEQYSDLTTDLTKHPMTKELSRLTNENAIKRSVRNILLTNKGERLFNSKFGSNLNKLLFEPIDIQTSEAIKHAISDTITTYEPRVKLSQVEVLPDEYTQSYRVNVFFLIVNRAEPVGLTVTLYRVR